MVVETRSAKKLRLENGVSNVTTETLANDNDNNLYTKKRKANDESKIDYTKYLNLEFDDYDELERVMINTENTLEFVFFRYEPENLKQYSRDELIEYLNKFMNWHVKSRYRNVRAACWKIICHLIVCYKDLFADTLLKIAIQKLVNYKTTANDVVDCDYYLDKLKNWDN